MGAQQVVGVVARGAVEVEMGHWEAEGEAVGKEEEMGEAVEGP